MISVKLCTLLCGIMSIAYGREEPDQEKHFTSPPSSSLEGLPDVEHTDKPVMESHNTAHMKLMSPPLPSLHNDLHQFHHNFTDVEGMFHNGTHLNTTGEHRFPFNNSESMPNHFIHGHQMMPNHSELHQNMSGEPHFEFNRPENYSHGIPPMPFHGMINHTELQLHHENMTFHNHSGGNETFIIPLPLRTIMPNLLPPTSVSTTVKPSKQPDTHPSNSGIVPPTTATKPSKQETLEAESDIFSCSDSCCQKFLNTTKCVFEKTANLSDNFTLNNEANADFRARIDQCFTSYNCEKPNYQADPLNDIHINWRPKLQIFKSWWDNLEDSQRQCSMKFFFDNTSQSAVNCIQKPKYNPEESRKTPFLEPRVYAQRRSVIQARVNVLRAAEQCSAANSENQQKVLACVRDLIANDLKPELCQSKKKCEELSGLNDDQTCRQKAIKINSDAKECLKRNTGFPKPNSEALESLIKGNEMKDTLLLECNAKLPKLESRTLQGTNVEVPSNVLTRMFQVMLARDLSKPAVEELCDA